MSKERDVGMKKCLKTKEMSRQKVSKEAVLTGNKKTGAKRKPCQENEMCREENVKRRRSQGKKMPKDKDAKGKRRQRKAAETTSASRGIDDTRKKTCHERRICQVSGFRAVDKKGCQNSEMPGASRIKRKWQHQTKMSRARNVKDKDFQEITQPTAMPARRPGPVPIGSPLSYRFFPLENLAGLYFNTVSNKFYFS